MSEFRRRLMMAAGEKEMPNYLCFTALEDNSTITKTGTYTVSLEYSLDGSVWNTFDANTTVALDEGESVYFRGNNNRLANGTGNCTTFVMTGSFDGSGSVMSLISATNFDNVTRLNYGGMFACLFKNCTSLKTPPELPATDMGHGQPYVEMFYGSGITKMPKLPALILSNRCYANMFRNCASLVELEPLPATILTESCYNGMFYNCVALKSVPALPATILPTAAYGDMFKGCTSLTTAPEMRVTSVTGQSCQSMFNGCTSLTDASKVKLDAETLAAQTYQYMFQNTKIDYLRILAVNIPSQNGTGGTFTGVPNVSTSICVKHIDTTWVRTDVYGVPNNWTVIYYDPSVDKYYTDQTKATECDDHGNPL